MDHAEARIVFGRFVAGAPVAAEDEERALAHAADCDDCARELGPGLAAARPPVDSEALFDRVLSTALRENPDVVARARAAEQLGARGRATPLALMALEDAAGRDPEPRVRAAARRALDALGGPVHGPGGPAPA